MVRATKSTIDVLKAVHASRLASIFMHHRTGRPINIINPELCDLAIKKADLSAYQNPILIDMNPGACIWSAALHDRLKPRSHILLEPEARYAPILNEFTAARPNAYWLPLDGYQWSTYVKLFKPDPPRPPWPVDRDFPEFDPKFVPPEDGVSGDIIFAGNLSLSTIKGERLLAQFLNCTPLGLWVQKFGRVRFLLWVQDVIKERYLPRGIGSRGRPAVIAETLCTVREIASSAIIRSGKGRPRASGVDIDKQGNIIITNLKPKKLTPGRPRRGKEDGESTDSPSKRLMTVEEIKTILERIDDARGDAAAIKLIEAELLDKETSSRKYTCVLDVETKAEKKAAEKEAAAALGKKRKGRPPKCGPKIPDAGGCRLRLTGRRALLTPELDRIRNNLVRVASRNREPQYDATLSRLLSKVTKKDRSIVRQKHKMVANLEAFLKGGDERWVTGMEHPPWWYRDHPQEISSLADKLVKQRSQERAGLERHIQIAEEETLERIEALEGLEGKEDTVDEEKSAAYKDFEEQWGKKVDAVGMQQGSEDELIAYQKKLLQWQNRPFNPLPVQDNDFWPANPLALLEFSPILTDDFFRPDSPDARDSNWEVYLWLLRGLLSLRAHSVSTALNSMVPGGEHVLSEVDEIAAGGKIDPNERIRTLTVKQLVEITKAWNKWPFKAENMHLDSWGDYTPERGPGKKNWGM